MSDCLEELGYNVAGIAGSSSDANQIIEAARPHIVLMSTRLKGGSADGIQTGSLISKLHDLPVIYVIEQSSQATIRRAGETGPFGYILRPFDEKQIFATIEIGLTRHQLERKLEQSSQWLNITLTSIGDGVIATDERGMIRFINPAASKLTGRQHADAVDKALPEVFSMVEDASHQPLLALNPEDRRTPEDSLAGFEGLLRARDGKLLMVEAKMTPIKDSLGNTYGNVLVFRDITQQRQATAEIRRQAERAEALVQAASQLNARQDLETVLRTISDITNRALNAAGTAVILQDASRDLFRNMAMSSRDESILRYVDADFEIPADVLRSLVSRERPVVVVPQAKVPPGTALADIFEDVKVRTLAIAALFQGEEFLGALISIFCERDHLLTEDESALLRGLANQASSAIKNASLFEQVRASRERQRELAKSLVEIQEAERQHIAQELHDQLGQHLTGLQFMLESSKGLASGTQRTDFAAIQDAVRDLIGQVREMSLSLRPSMLDDMGLLATLHWHLDRYSSQTGIRVNFESAEFSDRFPAQIEIAAYRIIQEGLTNVARHAGVEMVFVALLVQDETLWVEILDNGRGFDPATGLDSPTSGLGGMRERASLAGGYLTVRSFVNQGTQIVAALPLSEHPLERRKHDRDHFAG